jgi:predicted protein tyrosine phosphatase
MRIWISSRADAERIVQGRPTASGALLPTPTHVVSIYDSGDKPIHAPGKVLLPMEFDDVSEVESAARHGYVPPTRAQVREIINFARRLPRGKGCIVLVHCAAGVSRSPASAIAMCCACTPPEADERTIRGVLEHAVSTSAIVPNKLVIRYAEELTGRPAGSLAQKIAGARYK